MKILVYDDSTVYGGHQVMACHGIEAVSEASGFNLTVMASAANDRLRTRLAKSVSSQVLDAVAGGALDSILKEYQPDAVLSIQGDLSQSTAVIDAAARRGIRSISYLALPHRKTETGAKLARIRDLPVQRRINRVDGYITISEGMRRHLTERGVTKPILTVPNGVAIPEAVRERPLPKEPVIGVVGRVEFKQKRQHDVVDAFNYCRDSFGRSSLLIVGDGPDSGTLEHMISSGGGSSRIKLQPWIDDMDSFYERIDMLLIPSLYEGVPLVMLEALARGIPVLGSRIDGLEELLPPQLLFEPGNAQSIADTVGRFLEGYPSAALQALYTKVRTEHSLTQFMERFPEAILQLCDTQNA